MNDSIGKYLRAIESEIAGLRFGESPRSLYEPIRYIMSLGGKRLRPLLTVLSYSLYRNDSDAIVRYAAAVEAFHNFTLMHDDIMDQAPLRRGKRTVHEKWNKNTAILSGDVMLVKVYDLFLGLESGKLKKVLQLLNECAAGVCEGQQMDMDFETKSKVSKAEYLDMIQLKTAVLLGFSLELGAVLAEAPESDQRILRTAGINFGLAFQLMDDLLDVFGDKKKFGKQVGGDIIANKKTFLLIKALERSKGKQKQELKKWLSAKKFDSAKKVKEITSIYQSLDIQREAEQEIELYFDKGLKELTKLSSKDKTGELIHFAKLLATRQR